MSQPAAEAGHVTQRAVAETIGLCALSGSLCFLV